MEDERNQEYPIFLEALCVRTSRLSFSAKLEINRPRQGEMSQRWRVPLWISMYSICSTAMLLGNKVVLNQCPFPLALTCAQLTFAAATTFPILVFAGFTKLTPREVGFYIMEGVLFSVSIFASLKSLSLTNVGTVLIARSCLPIVVLTGETMLGKKLKLTGRSCLSLVGVFLFGTLYALDAKGIRVNLYGVLWVIFWIILVAGQMIYGKWLVNAIALTHVERVFYTNACGLPLLLPIACVEFRSAIDALFTVGNPFYVFLSCVVGVSIGYTSWQLRAAVSATTFSLTGVLNKMGTICIAFFIWPEEGSIVSFAALTGCIISGLFYQGASPVSAGK
mmetsp:Transcript_5664/g.23275  ORF Transcript_5664/g.23275 Transcript_5664/m.23275 type:complete len:335 (+) Transcript_5664:61-1065(+)